MAEKRYDDPIEKALWGAKRQKELFKEHGNRIDFDVEGMEEENQRRTDEWNDNIRHHGQNPFVGPELLLGVPENIGHLPGQVIPRPLGPMDYPNNQPPTGQDPSELPPLPALPPFGPLPDKGPFPPPGINQLPFGP